MSKYQLVTLGKHIDILSGFAFPSSGFNQKNGVPLIRIRDILFGRTETYYEGSYDLKYLIKKGDLLVGMDGDFNREYWKGTDALLNQRVCKITPNPETLDKNFLYHFLQKELDKIHATTDVVTVKHLSVKKIQDIKIRLPSLKEQKRIAAILDKADGIRQKREQAIKLADDFLRATFLEMFPQLDDCGNKVKLGDIVTLDAPMVDPREDKFIDLIHIGPDRIERNTGLLLPALTAREENLISKKFLFDENYVLYSKIRPYLKKCAIPDFGGLCSADMYPVKPISGKTNREFIWQLLLSDFFTKYTETLPDRANIPKLNRKELLSFELSLPPIPLQEKYKAIVQKTNQAKLIMRTQHGNSILNQLADELFSTN